MPKKRSEAAHPVEAGALAAEELVEPFPDIELPVQPPFPPEEARSAQELPADEGWSYEPKWDGFRCLAFRSGDEVLLQSKAGQPLGRYFPELVTGLRALAQRKFVLDGEIVIFHADGQLAFDELLMRIHPAESRIKKLARETPVTLMCFDLLVNNEGRSLLEVPRLERRNRLTKFLGRDDEKGMVRLSPATLDRAEAEGWMQSFGARGLDGVVAKRVDSPYLSGERTAMVKVKRMRTADCVVGGFRYAEKGGGVGSLLLGLYNSDGALDHVGYTSSFNAEQKQELKKIVEPLMGGGGLYGKGSRRAEPVEHQALFGVECFGPEASVRGTVRPFFRRTVPARKQVSALAAGEAGAAVWDGSAAMRNKFGTRRPS